MTEYIKRTDAMNAVLVGDVDKDFPCMDIAARLHDIPAADVRPVVLCRDCKWTKTDGMDDPAIYFVQWDRWEAPPDGFCWLGEKREES